MGSLSSSPVSVGDVVAGKYRVERWLGSGGMGIVVLATHLAIRHKVALKFLKPATHDRTGHAGDYVARFLREAQAAGGLSSEHVARVYDAGTLPDGTPYIAMEFVDGEDLSVLLEKTAVIAVPDAVEYVLQATEALIEAHGMGIVHRDLKPQNLLLGRRLNGTALIKVVDFGIAKAVGGIEQKVVTDSAVVLGSPLYMSPEQMRGGPIDARSDQWSLGVILYQLLTRRLPFEGNTVPELCMRVMTESPQDMASIAEHVPAALVAVVARCLERNVSRRFAHVAELSAALEPFSRSFERGIVDRPWRSFAETAGHAASPAPFSAQLSAPLSASPGAIWVVAPDRSSRSELASVEAQIGPTLESERVSPVAPRAPSVVTGSDTGVTWGQAAPALTSKQIGSPNSWWRWPPRFAYAVGVVILVGIGVAIASGPALHPIRAVAVAPRASRQELSAPPSSMSATSATSVASASSGVELQPREPLPSSFTPSTSPTTTALPAETPPGEVRATGGFARNSGSTRASPSLAWSHASAPTAPAAPTAHPTSRAETVASHKNGANDAPILLP